MFKKKRLYWPSLKPFLGEYSKDYHVLQDNGGKKDGSQMIIPVGNRRCPLGLEGKKGWQLWELNVPILRTTFPSIPCNYG